MSSPIKRGMPICNSDLWILAGIISAIGGIGIWEGYELHPGFYAHPAILFGGLGYMAYKAIFLDHRKQAMPSVNSEESRSG